MDFIHDLIAVVVALRWVLVFIVIVVLGWLVAEHVKHRNEAYALADSLEQENQFLTWRINTAEHVEREKVLDFINARSEYVTALRNCPGDADTDYYRWSGHAEARRQLATKLGLTIPYEMGQRAEPSLTHAQVVNG
jgi:hypothetical protein